MIFQGCDKVKKLAVSGLMVAVSQTLTLFLGRGGLRLKPFSLLVMLFTVRSVRVRPVPCALLSRLFCFPQNSALFPTLACQLVHKTCSFTHLRSTAIFFPHSARGRGSRTLALVSLSGDIQIEGEVKVL